MKTGKNTASENIVQSQTWISKFAFPKSVTKQPNNSLNQTSVLAIEYDAVAMIMDIIYSTNMKIDFSFASITVSNYHIQKQASTRWYLVNGYRSGEIISGATSRRNHQRPT